MIRFSKESKLSPSFQFKAINPSVFSPTVLFDSQLITDETTEKSVSLLNHFKLPAPGYHSDFSVYEKLPVLDQSAKKKKRKRRAMLGGS